MKKLCLACLTEKPISEFHYRSKTNGTYRARCKACMSEYHKNDYQQRPRRRIAIRETQAELRQRNKEFVKSYLLQHPCVDCNESDPIVLEFDHLRDKTAEVCDLVHRAVSIERLEEEISKCEVRCANCHRRITHIRRSS